MMFCLRIIFLMLWTFSFAYAHSGRTDENGCHNDTKTGDYHCHDKKNISPESVANSNYEPQLYTAESTDNITAVNKVVEVITNPLGGDSKPDQQESKKEEAMSEPANGGSLKQLPRDPTVMSGNFRQELKRRSATSGTNPSGANDSSNSNIPPIELVGKIMGHPKSVVLRVNKQMFHIVEGGQTSIVGNQQFVTIRVKKITQNLVKLFVSPPGTDLILQ